VMGTHVSSETEPVFSVREIDIVIRREPEQIIRNLCRKTKDQWAEVDGISYRASSNGTIQHNPDAGFLPPEAIPFPAWHLLDLNAYRLPLKGRRFLTVAPNRGCPFNCNFCTAQIYYGKKLRKRPVNRVVSEIEHNISRYQITDFFIWADTFTADRDHVHAFCSEIISRKLDILWTCNSRVDTVDRELLALMKKAGLWMISFGLESGDERILLRTGKRITPAQSKKAVACCHELGIKTSGHYILGLPGETRATMEKSLNFALDLPLDIVQFYTAAPFPGTGLYQEAVDRGWLDNSAPHSQSQAVMELPGLPSQEVDAFRRLAYRKFYLRREAVERLLKMVEAAAIRNIFANLKGFFQWAKG